MKEHSHDNPHARPIHSSSDAHPSTHAGPGHDPESDRANPEQPSQTTWILFILIGLVVALTAYNQLQITDIKVAAQYAGVASSAASFATQTNTPSNTLSSTNANAGTSAQLQALSAKVMSKGIPAIYGPELRISYDDPVSAMAVLSPLDDGTTLNPEQLARYTKITLQISCEYCCGAESIVFANGQAACGCQHSYVMRGLAKYLVTKHGGEYTDDQILEELGKWKVLFFPKPMLTKALAFEAAGKPLNIIDLTSNKYRGFEKTAAAAQSSASGPAGIPNQVGGC
ncbi:hypothetical protein HY994_00585 [Candidatus Micrarchaeota archaeon]|nr:hypothetical protein [Candidatus Micrarchaeota archaeon]